MASKVYSTFFGLAHSCHYSNARFPCRFPRQLPVSCKIRPRNFRKQQLRKISPQRPPVDVQPSGDASTEVQIPTTNGVSNSGEETGSSADASENIDDSNDSDFDGPIILEESEYSTENASDVEVEQLTNVQLEDLLGMIRNAEKNIVLLNQARVRALEDLDKILAEKEDLQGQINILEMRLAETDARIKVAAQEKIHVELLENQLEKLKNEISNNNATKGSDYDISKGHNEYLNGSDFTSLSKELDALRRENAILNDDIQVLKSKLVTFRETDERVLSLEEERYSLQAVVKELESRLAVAQEDVSKLATLQSECKVLWEKVQNLQELLEKATSEADQTILVLQQNHELRSKVDSLEASLEEVKSYRWTSETSHNYNEHLQQKVKLLEERLQKSDEEIHSLVQLHQESVKEFQDTLDSLKTESKRRERNEPADDMPWEFWSRILLMVDGWLLEKKISSSDAKLLRDMAWKRDGRMCDAYLNCIDKSDNETFSAFLKLTSSRTRPGLHVIHIAAEMAPVAKVGGLGDVVTGLGKALQKRGHLVEIVLPKYDCMQYDRIGDLKAIDTEVQSYFDGQLFKNKIWVGTVEGLPTYFIEPHHPAKFFWRGQFYGENDDFMRFSYFSRAALELLLQAGKKPDIIHCHDWQTAFVAPLYWDLYAPRGLNTARICFTCHNFEYQGTSPASELASCGLDVQQLNRPDRMQDNSAHDRVNPIKGAIVFSNIVTTVSPTYAQEVRTPEGGRGLHGTLNSHSRKFIGILNGIDTDAWSPSTDAFIRVQYNANDLQGKAENKDAIRKQLQLSYDNVTQPLIVDDNMDAVLDSKKSSDPPVLGPRNVSLVGCITRLVPQKGVHLIRHAMYRTLELGGQFVLLGSSPVPHIQREFEGIANYFKSNPHIRLILKYDEALSHLIYAASDMFIIPSIFEPCGLTQMIAMRYGSVPIVRRTGGLNDSVFDIDDETVPHQFRNGFTFLNPDEQGVDSALERAFNYYKNNNESWQQLVQKNMKIDFSWDSSAAQYEELYEKSVARARAAAARV